jgi:hypothetical protein
VRAIAIFALLLIIIIVAVTGTDGNNANRGGSGRGGEPSPTTYIVIHETGLYPSPASEDWTELLTVGTTLVPPEGHFALNCVNNTIEGVELQLCKVEVRFTGDQGWVLRKWIEKQ